MSLRDQVIAYNKQTKAALQTVYDALNNGQRKKLLKDDTVKKLFDKYGVDTDVDAD